MKQVSFGFLFLSFFLGLQKQAIAQPMKSPVLKKETDSGNSYSVSLFSNGYAYPKSGDEVLKNISEKGISGWKDDAIYFKTFFYPKQTGEISVSVKLKSSDGNSKISLRLDSSGKSYEVAVNKTAAFVILPVGTFEVNTASYHFVQIKGISKTGNYFPEIESIIISGPCTPSAYPG